jgi:hypothetical protein
VQFGLLVTRLTASWSTGVPDCEIVSASDSVDGETYCGRRRFDDALLRAGISMVTATIPLLFEATLETGVCCPTPPPPLHAARTAESEVTETSARVDDIAMPFIEDDLIG